MTHDATRRAAAFAAGCSFDTLPLAVVDRAKSLLLDIVGITVRARHEADSTAPLLRAVERLGLVGGACTVVADARGFAPPAAALVNGALAHSLDFDDTHARSSLHPSAPIVPTALAAAELVRASGRELIAAIVAGYEIQIRLSLALDPSAHYRRGFHPTATCGAFGAAAAAGRLLGLDEDAHTRALGLCGSMAAGSMQFLADGAWNKRFHTGHAAYNGLVAAVTAAEGYRGAAAAFEGSAGFLPSYAPAPNVAAATAGLGESYETLGIAVKPYPSCRYGHAAIDALLALRAEHGLAANDIRSVLVGLPLTGHKIIGEPLEGKQRPRNVVDGQFSMPFMAAVALRTGGLTWDDYATHLGDRETLELCTRVHTRPDPAAEAHYPASMSAIVRIETGHRTLERLVVTPRGEPQNFLTRAELVAKFETLTAPYVDRDTRQALSTALLQIDRASDVRDVARLMRSAAASGAA